MILYSDRHISAGIQRQKPICPAVKLRKRDGCMTLNEIQQKDEKYYMNTFGRRTPVCFEKGSGITLTDSEGNVYKDFFAGIAVNCLGYAHPKMVRALREQVGLLTHVSNVFYNENQTRLAETLVNNCCGDRVFFANTGAEANEGAIKLAKKYFVEKGQPHKYEFVTLRNSFHGRTLATVAATGQEKYQKPYRPLVEKFVHVDANNINRLKNAVNANTAAVMTELIQGEGGVVPLDREYVSAMCEICKENGALLIADEVQTGIGRTGKLFAYEWYGIEPDIVTMAKGLGGGIPIGAFAAKENVAAAFKPGDHGTTFGGNPLSARAGLVVLDELLNNGVLDNAAKMGEYFMSKLKELAACCTKIKDIRGRGLMLGVVLDGDISKDICAALRKEGFIVGTAGASVLRIVPPLILTEADIDDFAKALKKVCA